MRDPGSAVAESLRQMRDPGSAVAESLRQMRDPGSAVAESLRQMRDPGSAVAKSLRQLGDPASQIASTLEQFGRKHWSELHHAVHAVRLELRLEVDAEEPFEFVDELLDNKQAPLGQTLASLPLTVQVTLLIGGLQVLDRAERFLSDLAHLSLPPGIRSATDLLFASIIFLVLWIDQVQPPSDE
jgi:hypothetical protein